MGADAAETYQIGAHLGAHQTGPAEAMRRSCDERPRDRARGLHCVARIELDLQAALAHASVFLNGGQRGLQIELDPHDAVKAAGATARSLTA